MPGHPAKPSGQMRENRRVENSGGITASLQGRYASALFELASEHKAVTQVESDLDNLGEALRQSSDLAAMISNPQISRDAAAGAMNGVAELLGLSPVTKNFLGVLAANRRLGKLPEIVRAFAAIAAAARGEVTADVTSAHPLTAGQLSTLAAKLKEREGKEVKIKANVDPELLGGLVVRIGSRQIDSSIRTRLNTLANAMKG